MSIISGNPNTFLNTLRITLQNTLRIWLQACAAGLRDLHFSIWLKETIILKSNLWITVIQEILLSGGKDEVVGYNAMVMIDKKQNAASQSRHLKTVFLSQRKKRNSFLILQKTV